VEPFLISGALTFVGAQRLMRKVCKNCAHSYHPSKRLLKQLEIEDQVDNNLVLYKAKGCRICNNTGYRGRMAVMEALEIDDDIKELILRKVPELKIKKTAISNGMIPLRKNAVTKVIRGDTTLEELARVAGTT